MVGWSALGIVHWEEKAIVELYLVVVVETVIMVEDVVVCSIKKVV